MFKSLRSFLSVSIAAALLLAGTSDVALATMPTNSPATIVYQGIGNATAGTTFATTSYADLTGATVTLTPYHNDPTTAGRSALATPVADKIRVIWSVQAIKATATTITCGVYLNAALAAASVGIIDFAAKQSTMGGVYIVDNTTVGAQTVKLQCKSGDTNTGTVNFGQIVVDEITF